VRVGEEELTPEDGRLRPKHVVKEKGVYIYIYIYEIELYCDGNSDIVHIHILA
jgi:hypothetical protein